MFTRAQLCDWSKREREIDDIRFGVLGGRKVVSPFVSHSLLNDPSLQLSVAKTWAATRFPILRQPLIKTQRLNLLKDNGRLLLPGFSRARSDPSDHRPIRSP